jgi:glycosyltransferase involved in cell wall biosynthesis
VNLHNYSGFLSDVGDIEQMAEFAIDLLSDTDKLDLFKEQAKKRAEVFSLDAILPLYEKLYHEVMNQ